MEKMKAGSILSIKEVFIIFQKKSILNKFKGFAEISYKIVGILESEG